MAPFHLASDAFDPRVLATAKSNQAVTGSASIVVLHPTSSSAALSLQLNGVGRLLWQCMCLLRLIRQSAWFAVAANLLAGNPLPPTVPPRSATELALLNQLEHMLHTCQRVLYGLTVRDTLWRLLHQWVSLPAMSPQRQSVAVELAKTCAELFLGVTTPPHALQQLFLSFVAEAPVCEATAALLVDFLPRHAVAPSLLDRYIMHACLM